MSNDKIFALINFINSLSFSEFEMETDDIKIRIKRDGQSADSQIAAAGEELISDVSVKEIEDNCHKINAPIAGIFYKAPAPEAPPFVEAGDAVKKGDTLCIIEAMKMLNEIKSDKNGIIKEIIPKDGEPINETDTIFVFQGD